MEALSLSDCKGYYLYLKGQEITTTTIQTYIRALRAFLTWCYTEGYLNENIPERFKLPKAQRKTIDVLTDDELKRLFSCFDLRTFTGCRNYCICALMLGYAQNIISLVIPWSLVKIGLSIILAVELLCLAYQLVMWIIRKIPMAGMS